MARETLLHCWPELAGICLCLLLLKVLLRLSGARLQFGRIFELHRDQVGGVQTLSFVLTVPVFIFVMMFVVQLSQITVAKVVVEYAAFTAARSAIVWIPAATDEPTEGPNRISNRYWIGTENVAGDDTYLLRSDRPLDVVDSRTWGEQQYDVYLIDPNSRKHAKIQRAAAMACLSICPSRDIPELYASEIASSEVAQQSTAAALLAFRGFQPAAEENDRMPRRMLNKVLYALANTSVVVEVWHKRSEPPLWYLRTPERDGWYANEVGWQDQVTVHVTHRYALLPGPGRLLARQAVTPSLPEESNENARVLVDDVANRITPVGNVHTYAITATARLTNRGHIPVRPHLQTQLPGLPSGTAAR